MEVAINVANRINRIAQASGEQTTAGLSVAQSLACIAALVDNNTLSARDAKTAAEELAKSADELGRAGHPLTKCTTRT
jgi:aerotaxis receptor